MATRSLDLEEFIKNPSHNQLHNIRKVDWTDIVERYDVPITTSLLKEELKNVVVESVVDSRVLPNVAL